MLIPSFSLFEAARKHNFGLGAFNVNNMEQLQAIIEAAYNLKSPVIVQVSKNALIYADKGLLAEMVKWFAEKKYPDLPVALHLDHGPDLSTIKECIEIGFTSVMIDGSYKEIDDKKIPTSLAENIAITKPVVDYARQFGLTTEAEIGCLGGVEDGAGASVIKYTNPAEAVKFWQACQFDSLALAIGTSHGAYKFKQEPKLALDVIDQCRALLPQVFFVMHGSSSVPPELVNEINKYGGKVEDAKGVPDQMKQEFIKRAGGPKINIDTDGRLAATAAIRRIFFEQPAEFDPRKYLGPAREAQKQWVARQIKLFGSDGKIKLVQSKSLAEMKEYYHKQRL